MALENSAWKRCLRKIVPGLSGPASPGASSKTLAGCRVQIFCIQNPFPLNIIELCLPSIEIVCLSKTKNNRIVRGSTFKLQVVRYKLNMSAGRHAPVTVRHELQPVTGDIKSSV